MERARFVKRGEYVPDYSVGMTEPAPFIAALFRHTAGLPAFRQPELEAPVGLAEVVTEPRMRRSPAAEAVRRSRLQRYQKAAPVRSRHEMYRDVKLMSLFPSIYGKETHIDASY